ncbi:prevent-host-death family protein, partial [Lachnospiraceae bacterium oral taxon 082 str. F0431]
SNRQEVLSMNVNTENLVSITEANQNFSRVARMVDEKGSVVILKNNSPRYLLIEFNQAQREQSASDEDILALSKRLIEKNREAYEVLAK